MADKMVIVVEFDAPTNDPSRAQEILNILKPQFQGEGDVKVYGAVKETADAILELLGQ